MATPAGCPTISEMPRGHDMGTGVSDSQFEEDGSVRSWFWVFSPAELGWDTIELNYIVGERGHRHR